MKKNEEKKNEIGVRFLGVPLGENVDELAVDWELAAAGLRHFDVGPVEPEVGGVVPIHILVIISLVGMHGVMPSRHFSYY